MLFSLLGWWLVDREGELGWAPASHLEPSDDGSEVTTSKVFAPGKGELPFNNLIMPIGITLSKLLNEDI